jgi:hypothetical protein
MSNRGCLILLFFLASACNATKVSAQTAALQVQVYDSAGLKPAVLHEFIARTQAILADAGVSVQVDACPNGLMASCESQPGSSKRVVIRVVARMPESLNNARRPPLGQSFVEHEGGTYGSVFLAPVRDHADDVNVPWVTVLAYAAAHEIGHLLLGEHAHTPRGLMKANWDRNDFRAIDQHNLHFNSEQIRQLTLRYGASSRADLGTDASLTSPR